MQKERRTYTEEEARQFMEMGKTSGRKGVKMKRINMAFTPANYDYIRTVSKLRGESMSEFVNAIIAGSMERNSELYEQAVKVALEFDPDAGALDVRKDDDAEDIRRQFGE